MVVWGLARDEKEGKGEASKAPERTFFLSDERFRYHYA